MANKRKQRSSVDVDIEHEQYERLEDYSNVTGRSVPDLVQEAVANYIYCAVEPYFEVLKDRSSSA